MCTLAIVRSPGSALPLLVAANRDEFLDRPARAPAVLCTDPWVVAGQDEVAGGTWLGINERGVVAGILNRPRAGGPDPTRRSRGLLCLAALQAGGIETVLELVRATDPSLYNPFHLVVADRRRAFWTSNDGEHLAIREVPPGAHMVTNHGLDHPQCPRTRRMLPRFRALAAREIPLEELPDAAGCLLREHSTRLPRYPDDLGDGLCIHAGIYGTRSSSIIALPERGSPLFWSVEGPPCAAPYRAVALPTA